jgi:hypothetical protein
VKNWSHAQWQNAQEIFWFVFFWVAIALLVAYIVAPFSFGGGSSDFVAELQCQEGFVSGEGGCYQPEQPSSAGGEEGAPASEGEDETLEPSTDPPDKAQVPRVKLA